MISFNYPTFIVNLTENVTALDVKDGDVIYENGHRCLVSNVTVHDDEFPHTPAMGDKVARYNLTSLPNNINKRSLPPGYDGGVYGGNRLAIVSREIPNCFKVSIGDGHEYHIELNADGKVIKTACVGRWPMTGLATGAKWLDDKLQEAADSMR